MQFTDQHLKLFEELSHDKSPIHWDQAYARRTPFSNVVVYGIAAVLYGLGLWSQGRSFSISTIRGKFNRPLYKDIEYKYNIEENNNNVNISILHHKSELMRFTFVWTEWAKENPTNNYSDLKFKPKTCANSCTEPPNAATDICYTFNKTVRTELKKFFLLNDSQLPSQQLNTLLWSSYQVGMVWPGKQALYLDFKMKFNLNRKYHTDEKLILDNLSYKLNRRFNITTIIGKTESVDIQITAFVRPKPINYSFAEIKRKITTDSSLSGKIILVIGASRGFGSVLAQAFLLKGAYVIFNYRTNDKAITSLQENLTFYKNKIWFYQGDMSETSSCEGLKYALKKKNMQIDFLISNASPPIQPMPFNSQETEKFLHFVNASIAVCHNPMFTLLTVLNKNATIVNISSIYTAQPPKSFSHYVTSKWAIEGMTHALAKEYPSLNFVLARLPRILTDQTNINFDLEKKRSAIDVANDLFLKLLDNNKGKSNPLLINF